MWNNRLHWSRALQRTAGFAEGREWESGQSIDAIEQHCVMSIYKLQYIIYNLITQHPKAL